MNITEKTVIPLEILVATMNRSSLDFLDDMFKNVDISECHILIVNQTTHQVLLKSLKQNIRIINSFEKGLSKSRNLALQNAKGEIVLISDDDVIFEYDFLNIILKAFHKKPDAALITFIAKNFEGMLYRNYQSYSHLHTLSSIKCVISWEIAFRLENIQRLNIIFDENFGLGGQFTTAEEYLFVRDVLIHGKTCWFENAAIVSHPVFNSGQEAESDRIIYARAALHYKFYKQLAYLWLIKYLFFLVRHKYIQISDFKHKWSLGIKGIKDYQVLLNKLAT